MAPRWLGSSEKHGISRQDQVYAMVHANYSARLAGESLDDGDVWLYIGNPHAQTAREIEILITVYPDGRESVVFHAMNLGPKYRRFREDNPHGPED